jgi:hypothetical protein
LQSRTCKPVSSGRLRPADKVGDKVGYGVFKDISQPTKKAQQAIGGRVNQRC